MSNNYALGLKPSPIDKRDILMSSFLPQFSLPPKFMCDERYKTPVRHQEREGSCVGFACATGMKEWQEKKQHNKTIQLSPRFVYEYAKKIDPFPDYPACYLDSKYDGTSIRSALDIIHRKGVCEEQYWTYIPCVPGSPSSIADSNARNYRSTAYATFNNNDYISMKRSLIVNGPFVIGVSVYKNWDNDDVDKTGIIPLPNGSEFKGGHALCIVGYDDEKRYLIFKNSWGDNWGDKGYGFLSYDYPINEAYTTTDFINNVESIIKNKEKILDSLNESYTEESSDWPLK